MNKTASKLAASVQRAKTQPVNAPQAGAEDVASAVTPAPEATAPAQAPARPARAPRAKPLVEPPSQAETLSSSGDDHHNGGQPVFPSRVWPD
jgi:hypothetical protein